MFSRCTGNVTSSSYTKLFESTCLVFVFVCLFVLETRSHPPNSQTDNFSKTLTYVNQARVDEEERRSSDNKAGTESGRITPE